MTDGSTQFEQEQKEDEDALRNIEPSPGKLSFTQNVINLNKPNQIKLISRNHSGDSTKNEKVENGNSR